MREVCNVFTITREGLRLWNNQLREKGLRGLLKEKKVGKRSKINQERKNKLKNVIKQSPITHSYMNKKCTGLLIQDYARKAWGLNIRVRTDQLWLFKIR